MGMKIKVKPLKWVSSVVYAISADGVRDTFNIYSVRNKYRLASASRGVIKDSEYVYELKETAESMHYKDVMDVCNNFIEVENGNED